MTEVLPAGAAPRAGMRVWHLAVLVVFVAVAIKDIQDHARREPVMIGLAAAGFAAYGVIGWVGWAGAERLGRRLRPVTLFGLYAVAMSGLFLAAVAVYLVVEYAYVTGKWF